MTDAENGTPRRAGAAPAAEDQRLAVEIAHKEELLANQFAEEGRHARQVRRNEWLALAAVAAVILAILVATVR